MLKDLQTLKLHWGGVSDIVDRWLDERRELLVKYCDLIEVHDFDSANKNHGEKLKDFCEVMVDYVSVGHFEVYQEPLATKADLSSLGRISAMVIARNSSWEYPYFATAALLTARKRSVSRS